MVDIWEYSSVGRGHAAYGCVLNDSSKKGSEYIRYLSKRPKNLSDHII